MKDLQYHKTPAILEKFFTDEQLTKDTLANVVKKMFKLYKGKKYTSSFYQIRWNNKVYTVFFESTRIAYTIQVGVIDSDGVYGLIYIRPYEDIEMLSSSMTSLDFTLANLVFTNYAKDVYQA